MGDVLECKGDIVELRFGPKKRVLIILQRRMVQVIPGSGVSVKHCRRFDHLALLLQTPLTVVGVMRIALGITAVLEQKPQHVTREDALDVLLLVHHTRRQRKLHRLPLEDFLLDGAGAHEPVDEAIFLLAVTPHTRQSLLVCSWVPVRVHKHQAVGTDQVDTTAAGLGRQEENELRAFWVVELVDDFLPLVDGHGAVEPETAVALVAAHFLDQVQGTGVVGDDDDLVVCLCADLVEEALQHRELGREPRLDLAAAAAALQALVVVGNQAARPGNVVRQRQQVRVGAEFFEHVDGLQRLGRQQLGAGVAADKVLVERALERRQPDKHHVLVLDRQVLGQDVVCAADDELGHGGGELRELECARGDLGVGGVCVTATENGVLEVLAELGARPEVARVGERQEREVLGQVVLDRGAAQDHAAVALERVQRGEGERVAVFEAVALVREQEADLGAGKAVHVAAQRLVGDDEHRAHDVAALGHAPLQERLAEVRGLGGLAVDRQRRQHPGAEPLDDLVGPVAHERQRAHDDALVDGAAAARALAEQRPHEREALEGFAEAHFVGHDAALGAGVHEAGGAAVEEAHAGHLVGAEDAGEAGVDDHGHVGVGCLGAREAKDVGERLVAVAERFCGGFGVRLFRGLVLRLLVICLLLLLLLFLRLLLPLRFSRKHVHRRVVQHYGKLARRVVERARRHRDLAPRAERRGRAGRHLLLRGAVGRKRHVEVAPERGVAVATELGAREERTAPLGAHRLTLGVHTGVGAVAVVGVALEALARGALGHAEGGAAGKRHLERAREARVGVGDFGRAVFLGDAGAGAVGRGEGGERFAHGHGSVVRGCSRLEGGPSSQRAASREQPVASE